MAQVLPMLTRARAFSSRGVLLSLRGRSRSGVRDDDGMVVFAMPAAAVRIDERGCLCPLWLPADHAGEDEQDRELSEELLEHCRLAVHHGLAEGFLLYGDASLARASDTPAVAFHPDLSAHQGHQLITNSQAESRATILACRRTIGLGKRLKDHTLFLGSNTNTRIAYRTIQGHGRLALHRHGGRPGRLKRAAQHFDHHFAFRSKLESIADEIHQDLAPPDRIAQEEVRDIGADIVE